MQDLTTMTLCNMAASHFMAAMEHGSGHDHPVLPTSSHRLPHPSMDAAMFEPKLLREQVDRKTFEEEHEGHTSAGAEAYSESNAGSKDSKTVRGTADPLQAFDPIDKVVEEMSRLLKKNDDAAARAYARHALTLLQALD